MSVENCFKGRMIPKGKEIYFTEVKYAFKYSLLCNLTTNIAMFDMIFHFEKIASSAS